MLIVTELFSLSLCLMNTDWNEYFLLLNSIPMIFKLFDSVQLTEIRVGIGD